MKSLVVAALAASTALHCGALAQTPPVRRVPVHGPGAVEALRAAYALVYRPRERGLVAVRFTATSRVVRGKDASTFGPWTITWRDGKQPVVVDSAGKPAGLAPSLVVRLIRDVIGDRGARDIESNHLRLDDDGNIEVRVPDWVRGGAVRRSLIVRDDEGRLAEQRFYELGNELASTVRYSWKKHGKLWCLESRSARAGDKLHVTSYERVDVGGFLLPETIVATAKGVACETITYSDYVVNPPPPKPADAPKKTDSGG